MAVVEITAGAGEGRGVGWQSRDTITQATATALQALSLTTQYALLVPLGGTGTAFSDGGVSLAAGFDGQLQQVIMSATGEITLHMTGTSTGALVYTEAEDFTAFLFINSIWRRINNSGATVAAAT